MENAGGNAAEGDGLYPIGCGEFQTGAVTVRQSLAVLSAERTGNDGAHRVQDVTAGEVIGGRDFGPSRRFLMSLFLHDFIAPDAKLDAGQGVNDVVDAGMAGLPASQQGAVCSVYDRVAVKRCDVALPEGDSGTGFHGRQIRCFHNSPLPDDLRQIRVLYVKKIFRSRIWRAQIKQRTQKPALLHFLFRNRDVGILGHFPLHFADQINSSFLLIHTRYS